MAVYYNELDGFAAQWLRNLITAGHIAPGDVDTRSIVDVQPDDLRGYTQCHFFAGIGGWSLALRLAGWSDERPVFTGSPPCQPFSSAGNKNAKRYEDSRDYWPVWARLIAASTPRTIFGEQVSDAGDWLDRVCDDLESMGYEVGAGVLSPVAVGFDHARPRIYFAGYSNLHSKPGRPIDAKTQRVPRYRGIREELALEDGLSARVGAMRAYGNAIVPQLAARFIQATEGTRP